MRQLMYALRFRGKVERAGADGSILKSAISAPGCTIGTRIGPEGLHCSLDLATGDEAILDSEWVFTSPTTFQESGFVAFGWNGHRLRFSTFGSSYLSPASDAGLRQGVALRWVEGGDGQFAGARGLIASILFIDDAGEVTDHQLGMIDIE